MNVITMKGFGAFGAGYSTRTTVDKDAMNCPNCCVGELAKTDTPFYPYRCENCGFVGNACDAKLATADCKPLELKDRRGRTVGYV